MSSVTTITVPKEYGYVVLSATSTFLLAFWHGARVGPFRKAAGVPYPLPYAFATKESPASKEGYLFNCVQRAHANFLENHSTLVPSLLIAGLKYPVASAIMGAGWSVSRIAYAVGYTRADKDNGSGRLIGSFFWLFQLGLIGMAGKVGWDMLN